jgi:PAS domain-containing protein
MLNLYSRALDCTSNGVVISDMSLPGQPVFYANPAFCRITGFDPARSSAATAAPAARRHRQPELDVLRQAVRAGEAPPWCCATTARTARCSSTSWRWLPVTAPDGRVQHYVGMLNDVTERERARLAIAERSARLNAVFDLSPDGFVVFDRDGGWSTPTAPSMRDDGLGWATRPPTWSPSRPSTAASPRCATVAALPARAAGDGWTTTAARGRDAAPGAARAARAGAAWCAATRPTTASRSCSSATSRARPRSTA